MLSSHHQSAELGHIQFLDHNREVRPRLLEVGDFYLAVCMHRTQRQGEPALRRASLNLDVAVGKAQGLLQAGSRNLHPSQLHFRLQLLLPLRVAQVHPAQHDTDAADGVGGLDALATAVERSSGKAEVAQLDRIHTAERKERLLLRRGFLLRCRPLHLAQVGVAAPPLVLQQVEGDAAQAERLNLHLPPQQRPERNPQVNPLDHQRVAFRETLRVLHSQVHHLQAQLGQQVQADAFDLKLAAGLLLQQLDDSGTKAIHRNQKRNQQQSHQQQQRTAGGQAEPFRLMPSSCHRAAAFDRTLHGRETWV